MLKVIILLLAFANIIYSQDFGKLKTYNKGEIFYEAAVKEPLVDKLGQYLTKAQFFDGEERSIQLLDDGISYIVKMIVSDSLITDKPYLKQVAYFTYELSQNVFGGKPVDIHLANNSFVTKKAIKYLRLGDIITDKNDELYYQPNIDKDKAQKFMDYLKKSGFLTGDGKIVMIRTQEGIFNFLYPVETGYHNDQEYLQVVKQFADQISKEFLNGDKIIIYLTDYYFDELRAVSNF